MTAPGHGGRAPGHGGRASGTAGWGQGTAGAGAPGRSDNERGTAVTSIEGPQ